MIKYITGHQITGDRTTTRIINHMSMTKCAELTMTKVYAKTVDLYLFID